MEKKRMKIKLIAWILAIVMMCSTAGAAVYYVRASAYDPPAVVLLESMLNGDRQWVIETIVEDNRTDNPYVLNPSEMSLMAKALSQYENKNDPDYKALFSLLVNVLTKYYYTGLWATDLGDNELVAWAEEHPAEMLLLFGGTGVAPLVLLVGQIKNLAETEQFDNILFSVFQDTYKSSWGESVNEQEMMLQQLNEISDTFSNLSDMTGYWEGLYGTEAAAGKTEGFWQYMEKVAVPLYNSGGDFLKAFKSLEGGEQAAAMAALTIASSQSAYNWLTSESKKSNDDSAKEELKKYIVGTDASKFLEQVSAGFEWTSTLISQYSFLHSLYNQKELFQGTVNRMASQASSDGQKNMSRILTNYAAMMDTAYSSNKLQLVTILRTLSSMSNLASDAKISTIYDKTVKFAKDCGYKNVPFSSISSVFDVGMTVVDQCTGLKNTCLKTYELKYLRDIINEAKKVYENDLLIYTGDPTEENANKVLMDLLMIQRLRLKGENIAYNMTKGQLNSWIGKLLTGYNSGNWAKNITSDTELAEAWKEHYQRSVDALVGATICPFANDSFQVAQGEELFILYDSEKNTYRARYTKAGKDITLYEMQYRVMNGIKVNGGDVTITGVSVPFVVATGTSKIAFDRTAKVGEITQSGTCTLELYNGQSAENYTFEVPFSVDLQNAVVKLNGNTIDTPKLTLTNGILLENGNLITDELTLNGATVTGGTITCTGNVNKVGSTANSVSSLILNGAKEQNVSGTLNVGNLTLNNRDDRAISINGTVNVSGILSDPENIVTSGLTLVSGAQIAGDNVASDITVNGAVLTKPVLYERNVTLTNGGTLNGGTIKGLLKVSGITGGNTGETLLVKNGLYSSNATLNLSENIEVYGEAAFNSTTTTGAAHLKLYCTDVTGSGNSFQNLDICGKQKQSVSMSAAVENLLISNSSLLGVDVTGTINATNLTLDSIDKRGIKISGTMNVSGVLNDPECIVTSGLVLSNTAQIEGNTVASDLVLNGTVIEKPVDYQRSVTVQNSAVFGGGSIGGSLKASGASIENSGERLCIEKGLYCSNTTLNLSMDAEVEKEAVLNTVISNGEGVLKLCGTDIAGTGNTIQKLEFGGNLKQSISMTANVEDLNITNKSIRGLTLSNPIQITNSLIAGSQKIVNGENLQVSGDASIELNNAKTNLTLNGWNGDWSGKTTGNVYVSGETCFADEIVINGGVNQQNGTLTLTGAEMSFASVNQKSGAAMTLDETAVLTITNDTYLLSTLTNNGKIISEGDFIVKGTFAGTGEMEGMGDVSFAADTTFGNFVTSGKAGQTIDGTKIYVDNYTNQNNTYGGVRFNAKLYVADSYVNEGHIRGNEPMESKDYAYAGDTTLTTLEVTENTAVNGTLTVNGATTVAEGTELNVRGDMSVTGALTISKDAVVNISKNLVSKSNTITLEEGAKLVIKGNFVGTTVTLSNNGACEVLQDCKLSSGSVSGSGKLILYGDLENSATVSGLECLELAGKAPQKISGNALHVNQIVINNPSKSGVNLSTTIYYRTDYTLGENCNVNEEKIVEEAE